MTVAFGLLKFFVAMLAVFHLLAPFLGFTWMAWLYFIAFTALWGWLDQIETQ